jgi:hypothetical protein
MKEETIKSLIEKYKSGTSSLQEEELLFDNASESDDGIKTWSTFVKNHKNEAPENFNNTLWESFEKRKNRIQRFRIGVLSAAASVLLIVAFFINNSNQNEFNNLEKKALLEEAKSMFIDSKKTKSIHNILIESDLVIVYTKTVVYNLKQ